MAIRHLLVIFCEPIVWQGPHDDDDWRKKTSTCADTCAECGAKRQADHRYRFLISCRSEGSRRLLSDVPAKVPAKFSKMNSFWYNSKHQFGCGHTRLPG